LFFVKNPIIIGDRINIIKQDPVNKKEIKKWLSVMYLFLMNNEMQIKDERR
tara:strand:+ start:427 stop:579 length:153 start_codon:yes stop_codon:yes gene_type:complete